MARKKRTLVESINGQSEYSVTWKDVVEFGGDIIATLVGPTGSGKTARVHEFGKETDRGVAVVLLSTMPHEEVLGLPTGGDGPVSYRSPAWLVQAAEEPTIVFFDELDKAHRDVIATILTLISSRAVRGMKLHPKSRIVAAMQPVDPAIWLQHETQRALAARSCFIPIPYEWEYLESKYSIALDDLPSHQVHLPVLHPVSPRQVEWSIKFIQTHHKSSHSSLVSVLSGVVGEFAEELVKRVKESVSLTPQNIIEAIHKDPSLVKTLTMAEAISLLPTALRYDYSLPHATLIEYIWINGTRDDRASALTLETTTLQEMRDAGLPGIFMGEDEATTDENEVQAHLNIAKAWNEMKKARSKKAAKANNAAAKKVAKAAKVAAKKKVSTAK
jgi:hypothetical protein